LWKCAKGTVSADSMRKRTGGWHVEIFAPYRKEMEAPRVMKDLNTDML
jgi:hypothetical protein